MIYPFTEQELNHANAAWGCNCGPSALAFALQVNLDRVRVAIPEFDTRRYTSPTMMKAGLRNMCRSYVEIAPARHVPGSPTNPAGMFSDDVPRLVRIQWCGPWTAPDANPRWAYRQTHWICCYSQTLVFDCNAGVVNFSEWQQKTVPFILSHIPRSNGEWFPTHIWRLIP